MKILLYFFELDGMNNDDVAVDIHRTDPFTVIQAELNFTNSGNPNLQPSFL